MNKKVLLKFIISEKTGEYITFIRRLGKNRLEGVKETDLRKKVICRIDPSVELIPEEGLLYKCEVREMSGGKGYVVMSAELVLFKATIKLLLSPPRLLQIRIIFGGKIVYFDPIKGPSENCNTIQGVITELRRRKDLQNTEEVIQQFLRKASELHSKLKELNIRFDESKFNNNESKTH